MTAEWEQLKRDCAEWITPEQLDELAAKIQPFKTDVRTVLLELAQRFDRGSRFGRALRMMNKYRDAAGTLYPMTAAVPIGCVRFMFEAGLKGESEEDIERKLEKHMRPHEDEAIARWQASQNMGFFAYARSSKELQGQQQSTEKATEYVRKYAESLRTGAAFEDPDDPSVSEATKWLRKRKTAFAVNRFQSKKNAVAFVDALYAAASPRVVIENINDNHADSMTVHLPEGAAERREIFRVINEIGRPDTEDGGPINDDGGKHVGLWWD
jgi:hypothetical protein